MPYVPHTPEDVRRMLDRLGLPDEEALFEHIPPSIRAGGMDFPAGAGEDEVLEALSAAAGKNLSGPCFAGGGAYRHYVPPAVDYLASRSEFLTAYTPYQPEMMQGSLQAVFEYQTMMASLCGLDAANASMYDGATALYEAVLMAVRVTRRWKAVVDSSVNPLYREALGTYARNLSLTVEEAPFVSSTGEPDVEALASACDGETACVVTAYPNYFGRMRDLSSLAASVREKGALLVVSSNPLALALARSPGEMGADIVCGDAQPFGMPLSWGGPYLGFLAARRKFIRRMPGRLVGATVDGKGRRGFVLTLQTREQHIRREKAMSNICSNQAHCALRACIYLTLAGRKGLAKVAAASMRNARVLRDAVLSVDGVEPAFRADGAWFNEFAVRLPRGAGDVVRALAGKGIVGGIPLGGDYPGLGEGALLLAATELAREEDAARFAGLLREVLS